MNIKMLLGKRIQELRKAKKFTQEYVAEIVNIEPSSLSNIENGKYYPTAENLEKIAAILGVEVYELYTFSHHLPKMELISEMVSDMENNDKLALLMYKFYKTVKY